MAMHTDAERLAFLHGMLFGLAQNRPMIKIEAISNADCLQSGWKIPNESLDVECWTADLVAGGLTKAEDEFIETADMPHDPEEKGS